MTRSLLFASVVSVLALSWATPGHAIEITGQTDPNTTDPTSAQVPNWDTGWAQPAVEPAGETYTTGWNYVGQIGGASGTYLGNGYVLTAGHVGAGDFVLAGNTYDLTGTPDNIENGTVDLTLFQIDTTATDGAVLDLPQLTLATKDPRAASYGSSGSQVVMIGYGGGSGETWGENSVNYINQPTTPQGYSYVSNDFITLTGTTTYSNPNTMAGGTTSVTNTAQVVGGDSGGGDFIFNSRTQQWVLAGINEVTGTDSDTGQSLSGFVQIDDYTSQIDSGMVVESVPEPPLALLLCLGLGAVWAITRYRRLR